MRMWSTRGHLDYRGHIFVRCRFPPDLSIMAVVAESEVRGARHDLDGAGVEFSARSRQSPSRMRQVAESP